jgi:hypothetical protein
MNIPRLEEHSRAIDVFRSSTMYKRVSRKTSSKVYRLKTEDYKRLQDGYRSFMSVVCLAYSRKGRDNDLVCLYFDELKLWCFRHGTTPAQIDQVIVYLKWLIKATQSALLDAEIPEKESYFPTFEGRLTPFCGELQFINDFVENHGRKGQPVTLTQAASMSQIAAGSRALPFPSKEMSNRSIRDVINLITVEKPISREALEAHAAGMDQISLGIGKMDEFTTHISLSNSGANEISSSEGGRGAWMAAKCRNFCDIEVDIDQISTIEGLFDPLGKQPLSKGAMIALKEFFRNPEQQDGIYRPILLGDVLYVPMDELPAHLKAVGKQPPSVPSRFGDICILAASMEILRFGGFDRDPVENLYGLPLFRSNDTTFIAAVDSLPTDAALSIECGLKTRLVTAAPAGVTTIGQLFNNVLRQYLSRDRFLVLGFEEPDKLWELLKEYGRTKSEGNF